MSNTANNKISKSDLVAYIAESLNTSKVSTDRFLNTFLDVVVELVCDGKDIKLTGFGTFAKSERKARDGVNPKTKARIKIPGYTTASFKVGKNFKEAVKASGTKGLIKKK
jgi:DNA-binding protein HU-beta